jgi:tubulin--tyrosine ligase-like protein 12
MFSVILIFFQLIMLFLKNQVKDLLCVIARRSSISSKREILENEPSWLPTTFNLKTELPKLVAYFLAQEKL